MGPPLLNLTTDAKENRNISINGVLYALRTLGQLPLSAAIRFEPDSRRLGELMQQAAHTPAEEQELCTLLTWFVRAVLAAPDDVLDSLGDLHRLQIALAFTNSTKLRRIT